MCGCATFLFGSLELAQAVGVVESVSAGVDQDRDVELKMPSLEVLREQFRDGSAITWLGHPANAISKRAVGEHLARYPHQTYSTKPASLRR
jgi:hypothetical protein